MVARKPTPRCRTIGGVVYDLTPTERKAPCARGRPASSGAKPKATPASSAPVLTVEPAPKGGGHVLVASDERTAAVLGTFPTRDEAKRAKAEVQKTGQLPAPEAKPAAPPPFRSNQVRVSDHRVLERQERERAHAAREALEVRAPERSALSAAGRLPKRERPKAAAPALKVSERAVIDKTRKMNKAGLLYRPDKMSPTTLAIAHDLARRGALLEHGHGAFYTSEFAGDLERLTRNSARLAGKPAPAATVVAAPQNQRVSDYDRRRQKQIPLPASLDPLAARVGDRVSVFSYQSNEPDHAVLTALPGGGAAEPSVRFESGSNEGMNRHIRWERIFAGWLDPNVNWKPWKG